MSERIERNDIVRKVKEIVDICKDVKKNNEDYPVLYPDEYTKKIIEGLREEIEGIQVKCIEKEYYDLLRITRVAIRISNKISKRIDEARDAEKVKEEKQDE